MGNYSKQREEILNVVKEMRNHPTAEEIYIEVKTKNLSASKSTVYRNLNYLLEEGILKKISVVSGPDKYDYYMEDHSHIVCKNCGRVMDFKHKILNKDTIKEIEDKTDIIVDLNGIVIEGICKECKNK